MAAMAPSGVTKRTKAHAWPLRLPPRMRKTSSTSPCSSKIRFSVSSSVPGGAPPTKSLFSRLGCVNTGKTCCSCLAGKEPSDKPLSDNDNSEGSLPSGITPRGAFVAGRPSMKGASPPAPGSTIPRRDWPSRRRIGDSRSIF